MYFISNQIWKKKKLNQKQKGDSNHSLAVFLIAEHLLPENHFLYSFIIYHILHYIYSSTIHKGDFHFYQSNISKW